MTPAELIQQYSVLLKERHERVLTALAAYERALTKLLEETELPEPRVRHREAHYSTSDLSTVTWVQHVSTPGVSQTHIVRVELCASHTGLAGTARDLRSNRMIDLYTSTGKDYALPEAFFQTAKRIGADPTLPKEKWTATIYTY